MNGFQRSWDTHAGVSRPRKAIKGLVAGPGVSAHGARLDFGGVQLACGDAASVDRGDLVHHDVGNQRFAEEVGQHLAQAVQAVGLTGQAVDTRLGDQKIGLRDPQEKGVRAKLAAQSVLGVLVDAFAAFDPARPQPGAHGVKRQ